MAQWEPQIRTNLEDEVYQAKLDALLAKVPGVLSAGLVNVRFREGCVRLPGRQAAEPRDLEATIALTAGLFGAEGAAEPGFAEALGAVRPFESAYLNLPEETILASRVSDDDRVLLLTVPPNLNQGTASNLRRQACAQIAEGHAALGPLLDGASDVLQGVLLDAGAGSGALLDRYERQEGVSVLAVDGALVEAVQALFTAGGPVRGLDLRHRDGRPLEVRRADLVTPARSLHWARLRFDPEHLMVLSADRQAIPGLLSIMMRSSETEMVRVWVDGLLGYGIPTTLSPFPETQAEFLEIVRELRQLDENDLLGRLDVGGFANHPMGEGDDMQRCQECIYYLPNSKWCDLPELPVPVEPHWWCRLWKI